MANVGDVWDEMRWLTDKIFFESIRHVLNGEGVRYNPWSGFWVTTSKAHISSTHEVGDVEEGGFHLASLSCGLRFPFPGFVLELLNKYGIAFSQLASNLWRIVATFYLGCKTLLVQPHFRLFKMFYSLCRKGQYYHFRPRDSPFVINLSRVENWKDGFVQVRRLYMIGVSLKW